MLRHAESRHAAGDFASAIAGYEQLLKLAPNDKGLLYRLGSAERILGRASQAREHLRKAIRLGADEPGVFHELALTYKQQGRFDDAHQTLEKALKKHSDDPGLLAARAELFLSQNEPDQAWKIIQSALSAASPPLPIIMTFALIAPRYGEHERAAKLLQSAIDNLSLQNAVRMDALFRLGSLYDGMGEFDRAFKTIEIANKLKASTFDPEAFTHAATTLMYRWSGDRFRSLPCATATNDRVTFIVGMPRSGTTLVEQIIASHPDVFGAGECDSIARQVHQWQHGFGGPVPLMIDLTELTQLNLDRFASRYVEDLRQRAPKSAQRWTDKMPLNCLHLGLIARTFPRARVIHCRRDPMDTCLSCYFQHFSGQNPFAYDLAHLGRFYRDYERITDHWNQLIDNPMIDVHYRQLVETQESQTRRIINFLGLEWSDRCLQFHENRRHVLTSSQIQVRQPMYRSSLERWRAYEKYLDPLRQALGASHNAA